MQYRRLGRTGLEVSLLGLGSGGNSRLGQAQGLDQGAVNALVGRALELGVNVIDTAPSYDASERLLGEALAGVSRERYILCSKFQPMRDGFRATADGPLLPREALRASIEQSLRDLRTDSVELFYLHGVRPERLDPVLDLFGPVLEDLKREGLTRFLGITETFTTDHRHETLRRSVPLGTFDAIMAGYNLMSPAPTQHLFPAALEHDVGVVVMCAVRGKLLDRDAVRGLVRQWKRDGLLAPDAVPDDDPLDWVTGPGVASITDAAYKFAADHPAVGTVLTGTCRVEHLEANARAILGPPLPAAVGERIERLFGPIGFNVDR